MKGKYWDILNSIRNSFKTNHIFQKQTTSSRYNNTQPKRSHCFIPIQIDITLKQYQIGFSIPPRFIPIQIDITLKHIDGKSMFGLSFIPIQIDITLKQL